MKELKILIIDDEKLIRWSFEKQLSARGYKVFSVESGEEGIKMVEKHNPHIVFLDNKLPKIQGLDVIPKLKALDESVEIVFMTAYESVETVVAAMKNGAVEYINKPFTFEEIHIIIDSIKKKINIDTEVQLLRRQKQEDVTFESIICKSDKIRKIIELAKKIAKTETTSVLLLGASGTGKDMFAKAIHNESLRRNKAFVIINCSSLPETLLESELFGYEKGAFTDAKNQKKGLFEIAEGGTVFLDEIGEISLAMQVKLLGVLENRLIRRLGGTRDIAVDIRIIAATNKNLKQSIEEKTFREDLYYRLKVFQIILPSLNERKDDIPVLINHFIKFFNLQFGKKVKDIELKALDLMKKYDWPGNIRELKNVIERAVILESDTLINIAGLPVELKEADNSTVTEKQHPYSFNIPEEGISLNELEKYLLIQAMERTENNQTKAANLLGISRDTLRYKKKKHKL